jgi:hypothetical protein
VLKTFGAVALFAFMLLPAPVHAYRPFTGTDGDVAEVGEFELELGPLQFLREHGDDYLHVPATVLNLGIVPRVELVVDFVGAIALDPEPGEHRYALGDTDVFLKFLLRKGVLQEQTGPSIALETGPLTPEFHGEPGFGAAANLIVSEAWDWFLAHLNNQASLSRSDLLFAWRSTLITEYRWSARAWPVMELLWQREFRSHASVYSALAGVIWKAYENIDLDAAAVVASVSGKPSFEGRLGFTWAIRVWGEPEARATEPEVHD